MTEVRARNLSLLVAVSLPVMMVLFIMGAVFFSQSGPRPEIAFIYSDINQYSSDYQYYVNAENRIERRINEDRTTVPVKESYPEDSSSSAAFEPPPIQKQRSTLYIHYVNTDTSEKLSFEEAGEYFLDDSRESNEGYSLKNDRQSYSLIGEIFGPPRSSHDNITITGDEQSFSVGLETGRYDYQFIGWVLEE